MGTVGNQNPWTPYDNYKDCSLGVCSIYCPQFCYLIFPPPPPNDDSTPFSPIIIAIIGLLASAFLLVSYYTIVTRYCKRPPVQPDANEEENQDYGDRSQWNAVPAGLDEASIRNITVCKYKKGDGLIEGNECAVCLSEFQENESLRLLPKCDHAFHLPCIDTWFRTHSNCPLCRASAVSLANPSPNVSCLQVLSTVNVNAYEMPRPNDLILVVDEDGERDCNAMSDNNDETRPEVAEEDSETRGMPFRRSISLGTFSCKREVSRWDRMKIDEDLQMGCDECWKEIGCSKELLTSPVGIKRCVSTGRLVLKVHDKGKNSILPS